jgi:hypothetical protein
VMCRTLINSLGLFCDIAGVVLLYFFGLPAHVSRSGHGAILQEQEDLAEKARARRYDFWARFGFGLLVIGFALQLASNFMR